MGAGTLGGTEQFGNFVNPGDTLELTVIVPSAPATYRSSIHWRFAAGSHDVYVTLVAGAAITHASCQNAGAARAIRTHVIF